jgi:hypothetical protein
LLDVLLRGGEVPRAVLGEGLGAGRGHPRLLDSVPWGLMVKAVQANTTHEQRWIVLYVQGWLAALCGSPGVRFPRATRRA